MKIYEVIDHPADIGLAIKGETLADLFRHGAWGLVDLVTDVKTFLQPDGSSAAAVTRGFHLQAPSLEDLFYDWLRELLYLFSARKWIFTDFLFEEIAETKLSASGNGRVFDPRRHESKLEVKAVTYHQFSVKRAGDIWEARVLFDI